MNFPYFAQTYEVTTTSTDSGVAAASSGALLILWLVLTVIGVVAMWRVYAKAGQPGWAAIIPIYNLYVLLKIAGRPGWWLLLWLIPIVNIIISLIVAADVATRFGKSAVWGVILCGLLGIGYLILGFGSAAYTNSVAANDTTSPANPTPPVSPTSA